MESTNLSPDVPIFYVQSLFGLRRDWKNMVIFHLFKDQYANYDSKYWCCGVIFRKLVKLRSLCKWMSHWHILMLCFSLLLCWGLSMTKVSAFFIVYDTTQGHQGFSHHSLPALIWGHASLRNVMQSGKAIIMSLSQDGNGWKYIVFSQEIIAYIQHTLMLVA